MNSSAFEPEVSERLGYYVYRLIDPRNGETFYVGKGKGNRVFQHAAGNPDAESDALSDKIKRIREIESSGFQVAHVIHHHGLDTKTSFEVEAALIDAYPGLANEVGGRGSDDRGVMHADDIIRRYKAEVAKIEHRVIFINVNRSMADRDLYSATRYAWKINPRKARQAEYVLAVRQGLIVGAFIAEEWLPATSEKFAAFDPAPDRWAFIGRAAPDEIKKLYLQKRMPDEYRKAGAANPIKYSY